MRAPSSAAQLYAWHKAAMAGGFPPVHDGLPECGWFKTRLVKGGPWVAVEIRVERELDELTGELLSPEILIAFLDGQRRDPARLWSFLTAITQAEHRDLCNRRESIPAMAATHAALDLSQEPILP